MCAQEWDDGGPPPPPGSGASKFVGDKFREEVMGWAFVRAECACQVTRRLYCPSVCWCCWCSCLSFYFTKSQILYQKQTDEVLSPFLDTLKQLYDRHKLTAMSCGSKHAQLSLPAFLAIVKDAGILGGGMVRSRQHAPGTLLS